MWLIRLGKVFSVIYLVFAYLFACAHLSMVAAEQSLPNGQLGGPPEKPLVLIPMSGIILWAAQRLQSRLFKDINFDRHDWMYYRCIVTGSWVLYGIVFAIVMRSNK